MLLGDKNIKYTKKGENGYYLRKGGKDNKEKQKYQIINKNNQKIIKTTIDRDNALTNCRLLNAKKITEEELTRLPEATTRKFTKKAYDNYKTDAYCNLTYKIKDWAIYEEQTGRKCMDFTFYDITKEELENINRKLNQKRTTPAELHIYYKKHGKKEEEAKPYRNMTLKQYDKFLDEIIAKNRRK